MTSKVYVVQLPHRWDPEKQALVPLSGVNAAAEYGELVYLLSPKAAPFAPEAIIRELREKLADYCDDDWLVLIGNPALIGFAVAVAADMNDGRVQLLQWSGGAYRSVVANLYHDPRDVRGELPTRAVPR